MEPIQINITRDYIYQYVTTLTGTLGRQKEAYDKYVCLPDNYPVLDRFMDTAIAVVEASVWRKLQSTHDLSLERKSDSGIAVIIKNNSCPHELHGAIGSNIRLAIAYILTGMWLQGIDAELYGSYIRIADKYIDSASGIAAQHEPNYINYTGAMTDGEAVRPAIQAGVVDAIVDNIPVAPATKTGNGSVLTDDIPVNSANIPLGKQALKDGCINKHSALDGTILYPDGTIFS